jgi:hypothetical protein
LVCKKKRQAESFIFVLVCDIIRSEDVPIGIRQALTPVITYQQGDGLMSINEEGEFIFFFLVIKTFLLIYRTTKFK